MLHEHIAVGIDIYNILGGGECGFTEKCYVYMNIYTIHTQTMYFIEVSGHQNMSIKAISWGWHWTWDTKEKRVW